jgi:LysM repeat protein
MLTPAVVAFSALLLASSASAHCGRKYTVKEGDICDSISAATNTSTYQLAVVNHGVVNSECTNLVPGNEICLGWVGSDCQTTTIIQKDDSCEKIQSRSGINSTILYLNNPQINDDCSNIYIGEVLCVAKTVQVPDAPVGSIPATTIPATATPANTNVAVVQTSSVHATTTAAPQPTPTPAPTHDDEDDDCEDDDDAPSSSATPAISPVPTPSSSVAPAITPAPAPTSSSVAPAATSAAAVDNYDEDDESTWPFCDEL